MLAGTEEALPGDAKVNASEALLSRVIDYAGLFPPTALTMERAVREYKRCLESDTSWMLGNFVVPAPRLPEFAQTFATVCCDEQSQPWMLSVICDSPDVDVHSIDKFQQGAVFFGAFEGRAADVRTATRLLDVLPDEQPRYIEFPPDKADEFLPMLDAQGARAKIRAGGLSPESIPPVPAVAKFLVACAEQGVPFKATAGLHHTVRGAYPLFEGSKATATMHGFLNLLLAGVQAWAGADEKTIAIALSVENQHGFRLEPDAIHWASQSVTAEQIRNARAQFAMSFGSCSFRDPVVDLMRMHWIPVTENVL
jgi:hypothetical protein